MFKENNFGFQKKELVKNENNFSKEFLSKLEEFNEKFKDFDLETNDLIDIISQTRIPYNSHDKEKVGNDETEYLEDMGFINKINNLQAYLYNIEDGADAPDVLLKNYYQLKDEIKYLHDRFNSTGYLSDKNKGGDILKNDFPEIAAKIDSLMNKISELDVVVVSLGNRSEAQEKFNELGKSHSNFGEYIPRIIYIYKDGNIGFNSINIGTYHNPGELVVKLEKYLNEDLKNSFKEIQENNNFSEEEKEKRLDVVKGLIIGAQEYLDEFNNLIECEEK